MATYWKQYCLLVCAFGSARSAELPIETLHVSGTASAHGLPIYFRIPTNGLVRTQQILLLTPGYNGEGRVLLEQKSGWCEFADREGLVLVAPTFHSTQEEVHNRKGYYYPNLWSGKAVLDAVDQIVAKEGSRHKINKEKILLFGFSAGAHFSHRFALWKPERVKAFAAYSAAWWDDPTDKLRSVPGLIMCGEADGRFDATRAFMARAQELNLPMIWRGYSHTGHELTPAVLRMAQTFLSHYATPPIPTARVGQQSSLTPLPKPASGTFVGDVQSYRYYPSESDDAALIPAEERVILPSKVVAEAWAREE